MIDEVALEEEFARASLKRATFGRLLSYFRPHRRRLLLVVCLEMAWVLSMLVDPRLIRTAVDGPLARGDVGGVTTIALWMGLNILFRAVLTTWELRMSTQIGVQIADAIRRDVFDHIQRLSMRYFDRTKQGRIIARADRDVDTLEHLIFWGPILVTMLLLSLALGTTYLIVTNGRLALWLVAAIPFVWVTTRLFHKVGFPAYPVHKAEHDRVLGEIDEVASRWAETQDRSELGSWLRGGFPSWLVEHIQTMDNVTSRFLAQAGM